MPTLDCKHLFRKSLEAAPGRLHFAAHSHHPRLDSTRQAQLAAWDDAARLLDHKWDKVFGEVLPSAQAQVAHILSVDDPTDIAFAPNVHDLLVRLVSALDHSPVRILTTDAEFHSFERQARRWAEAGRVTLTRVPAEPHQDFPARFGAALASGEFDLVYASHVFYDSGYVFREVFEQLAAAPQDTVAMVDGYHGFMALPTDLGPHTGRLFYVSGGYKYAMCGEDVSFIVAPRGQAQRPVDTGWFAGFSALAEPTSDEVTYPADAARFAGATFDPTGLYRLDAALRTLATEGLSVEAIHAHARALSERLLEGLASRAPLGLSAEQLVPGGGFERRGNFLTFRRADARELERRLAAAEIVTDARADRLRFGFGLHQSESDVDALLDRLAVL